MILTERLDQIIEECSGPMCVSYEYDATPTAEERLGRVLTIARAARLHSERIEEEAWKYRDLCH